MGLKIYNSLSKKVEPFESISPKEISMYVCGITPDASTHLGHAFTYLSFDVLVRYLKFKGNIVNYLQNVTDIDDDILKRSEKAGWDWKEFGDHWTSVFLENMNALNWIAPFPYVKATTSIPTILKITESLVEKEIAYEKDGNVYFEVSKFGSYGELSGLKREEMIKISAERGADPKDPNKRDPLDFILWQRSKEGEPSWDSPWGKGRPGWHIECSSMIYENLGKQIDIHGGGEDLIYPHHESEIAQSESFTGLAPFAKYFMHTAYVRHSGEKMSKSLGNLVMVSDLLEKHSPNAIRFLLLSHHYRDPWDYDEKEIDIASKNIEKLEQYAQESGEDEEINPDFLSAIEDDLDTPLALKILLEKKPASLKFCLSLLGFQV